VRGAACQCAVPPNSPDISNTRGMHSNAISRIFDHIGGYSRDQVEGGAANAKAMASDAGIVLVCGTKNFVDATDEFRSCQGCNLPMLITIRRDGMVWFEAIFDVMLVSRVDWIKGWFLPRDPYVIASSFLHLRPWQVEIGSAVGRGRGRYVRKCSKASSAAFRIVSRWAQ
jgi:hypothetical protein